MTTSGIEYALRCCDFHGEYLGGKLAPCLYHSDTPAARVGRVVIALFTGILTVPLLPVALTMGVIGLPPFGCGKVLCDREKKLSNFDSPCVGALFCALGLVVIVTYFGMALSGRLTLNQTINMYLAATVVSVTVKVFLALRNHQPKTSVNSGLV